MRVKERACEGECALRRVHVREECALGEAECAAAGQGHWLGGICAKKI